MAWLVIPSFTSLGCAPLVGLDQDYYLIGGTGGTASAGGSSGTANVGGTGGAGMPAVAGAGAGGSSAAGAGGSSEAGAGGSGLPLVLPKGKLAYHRFMDYQDGNSESFIVELPEGKVSPELGTLFQLCGVLSPSFSPDGTKLAVAARPGTEPCPDDDNPHQEELEIYVLDVANLDSPSKVRVTENTLPDEDPSFAPSGDFLLAKRDGDIVKLTLDPAHLPHTTCEALAPGSFCFDLDAEQLKPVMSKTGLVFYQQGTDLNADIWYFDLAAAEVAGGISAETVARVATRADTYEARPCIVDDWLYFARGRTREILADLSARKSLAMLDAQEVTAPFGDDEVAEYTDPCGMGGDLVVLSSDEGGGLHDIFVGNFADGSKKRLDVLLNATVNSDEAELSPTFWAAPVP